MAKGFEKAIIVLDEPRAIYYAGQVLSGYIECDLTQPATYTVINVTFVGEANVYWTEDETEEYNGIRRTVEVAYKANEMYFNFTQCVAGGNGVVNLDPGNHRFPFQYQIPSTAPSSFEREQGSVTYKVVAYIDHVPYSDPSMKRDQIEHAFDLVAPFNLNVGDDIKAPIDLEFEEFYSCCCSSSPMTIAVHIPASGYCPGQVIPISIVAANDSNVEVKHIVFQLIQKICYHSKDPPSDYIPPEEVLEEIKTGPILSKVKREMDYTLLVPDMIAPNLQNCSIIDVGYFIKATVKLSGCNDDLEDETEICIGLIPLSSTLDVEGYRHPLQSDLPQNVQPETLSMAPMVNNHMTHETIANSSSYATASSYPTSPYPGGYSHPPIVPPYSTSPYPNSPNPAPPFPATESIPLVPMQNNNIGFVTPPGPYGFQPPYATSNASPYPSRQPPYPTPNQSPYPVTQNNVSFPAPSAPPPST